MQLAIDACTLVMMVLLHDTFLLQGKTSRMKTYFYRRNNLLEVRESRRPAFAPHRALWYSRARLHIRREAACRVSPGWRKSARQVHRGPNPDVVRRRAGRQSGQSA